MRKTAVKDQTITAGIDEAGYGPRLGPLVVTLTTFLGDRRPLEKTLAPAAGKDAAPDEIRIAVDDSKKIYTGRTGLAALEKSALAFWFAAEGTLPKRLGDLLAAAGALNPDFSACPWYGPAPFEQPLPIVLNPAGIIASGRHLAKTLSEQGLRFNGFQSRVIPEPSFNSGVAALGNKSHFLASLVLDLMGSRILHRRKIPAEIFVDKLGGRNHYAHLLAGRFPPAGIRVREESRKRSSYTVRDTRGRMDIHFVRSGDALHFPVALSSIFSKYVREIFMTLLNAYWTGLNPEIRRTAGYPQDALRFLDDIRSTAAAAGIDLELIVRER
jgi:ribonuclease HII